MRGLLPALAITLSVAAVAALPAPADPKADLYAATVALTKVHSVHIVVSGRAASTIDYVAPGTFHLTSATLEAIKIGHDYFVRRNGATSWTRRTIVGPSLSNPVGAIFAGAKLLLHDGPTVTDLGPRTVDGQTVHAYGVAFKGHTGSAYVNGDGLLVHLESGATTVDFSNLNGAIAIDPPPLAAPT